MAELPSSRSRAVLLCLPMTRCLCQAQLKPKIRHVFRVLPLVEEIPCQFLQIAWEAADEWYSNGSRVPMLL